MAGFLPSLETFAKGTLATAATLSTVGGLASQESYDLELKTSDGITLRCYLLPQSKELSKTHASATPDEFIISRPTVVMFHGNGGNHGHRIPLAKVFYLRMRCNVLMKGLQIDAQTALDYLTSDPCLSKTPIILYGQSIGGAVSIDLASKNPSKITALILENTFTSLPSLVPHALPLLGPFSFLCHQKWDSASKVPLIPATTPILMMSGLADELVPKEHMRALWEVVARRGETKTPGGVEFSKGLERAKYMEFEAGGHNDTCIQPGYWTAIADFVADLGDKPEKQETKL
ncbi:Alpha/Beta hydrolase protein [Mycena leptocephala]|nr:Alpha/Beta hydrolase protein [Mycena leptocephala]